MPILGRPAWRKRLREAMDFEMALYSSLSARTKRDRVSQMRCVATWLAGGDSGQGIFQDLAPNCDSVGPQRRRGGSIGKFLEIRNAKLVAGRLLRPLLSRRGLFFVIKT